MNTREALVRVGRRPLRHSPISRSLIASLNAHLGTTPEDRITCDTPGDVALARVYKHPQRETILNEEWGVVRDRDIFRALLIAVAVLITLTVFTLTILEVYGNVRGTPGQGAAVLQQIVNSTLRLGDGFLLIFGLTTPVT